MTIEHTVHGVLIDEATLTLDEFANACGVSSAWIIERVDEGLLGGVNVNVSERAWRFASAELIRARRLLMLERDFDANPELAALVADILEEIQRLKQIVAVHRITRR